MSDAGPVAARRELDVLGDPGHEAQPALVGPVRARHLPRRRAASLVDHPHDGHVLARRGGQPRPARPASDPCWTALVTRLAHRDQHQRRARPGHPREREHLCDRAPHAGDRGGLRGDAENRVDALREGALRPTSPRDAPRAAGRPPGSRAAWVRSPRGGAVRTSPRRRIDAPPEERLRARGDEQATVHRRAARDARARLDRLGPGGPRRDVRGSLIVDIRSEVQRFRPGLVQARCSCRGAAGVAGGPRCPHHDPRLGAAAAPSC